jgi:Zn-finger nucleic acid-binding protein
MKCPLCKSHTMNPVELAPDLMGSACGTCSGVWIARAKYDAWRARHPGDRPETPVASQITEPPSRKAALCPQCGHLLLPYRVGHGLPFSIDYCGACGGVWCDRREWDAIRAKNLHDNLHDIVSTHWQTAVRRADVQEAIEQTYKRLLGEAYGKAAELRNWMREHPQKSLILAYLSDQKPETK